MHGGIDMVVLAMILGCSVLGGGGSGGSFGWLDVSIGALWSSSP